MGPNYGECRKELLMGRASGAQVGIEIPVVIRRDGNGRHLGK